MLIVCHYNEIALKGKNRNFFEGVLMENIVKKIEKEISSEAVEYIKKISGRIIVKIKDGFKEEDFFILRDVFGLSHFSFAEELEQDLEKIKKVSWEIIKEEKFETFRISTSRSEKNLPLKSEEINREIGGYVLEKSGKKVQLKNADIEVFIEMVNKKAFVFAKKIEAVGGMPVSASGKALVLMSGGIDSPVAAYYALKRGVQTDYIHFHSLPYTSAASNDKVIELVKKLRKFQNKGKIFMVPLAPIQKEIVMKCPEKFRILLYRRMMVRIAQEIAKRAKYKALYTGESVAQVASQTLENIAIVNEVAEIPILRPLIGFDKADIIKKAREIGTYEISILPHEDCCTRFMPKKPETKGKIAEVLKAEGSLEIEKLVGEVLGEVEVVKV